MILIGCGAVDVITVSCLENGPSFHFCVPYMDARSGKITYSSSRELEAREHWDPEWGSAQLSWINQFKNHKTVVLFWLATRANRSSSFIYKAWHKLYATKKHWNFNNFEILFFIQTAHNGAKSKSCGQKSKNRLFFFPI